jgi:hypothetical protein
MKYVGLDLHKQTITLYVVNQDRIVLQTRCLACADTARGWPGQLACPGREATRRLSRG